jgi:polyisoprenoid-binding protein YceI
MRQKNLLPLIFAVVPALSSATTWQIEPNHTFAHFSVRHMMVSNIRGQFSKIRGTIVLDDADVTRSSIEATIDASTIDTAQPDRDKDLRSPNFFDVEKYPSITFKSKSVRLTGPNKYTVEGDLTMHGVTKPVTLDVEATPAVKDPYGNERRGAEATAKLNRRDFGLNWSHTLADGAAIVGDEIQIMLDIEAIHKAESAPESK